MSAFNKLRVLDLSDDIAGAFCTKLMAGFGAEVLKVEPLGDGDALRACGPFFQDREGLERSIPFHWFNTAKKSLVIDPRSDSGAGIVRRLTEQCDIVVESFSPGTLDRMGLGYDALRAVNPRLVLVSITPFGQDGPYRDYEAEEITTYAMSGGMFATGHPEKPPLACGPSITRLSAGMKAYVASLMGFFHASRTGSGDWIDLSIHETAIDNVEIAMAEHLHLGKIAKRANDEHALVPWRIFPCRDGHAAIIGGPVRHWLEGASLFEEPELTDETHDHMSKRIAHRQRIRELMAPWLSRHDKKDIYHAGQARGLAFSYLASLYDVMESPQLAAREFFQDTEHPETGRYRMAGAPFRGEVSRWSHRRAPLLGEHTRTVLAEHLGLSERELDALEAQGAIA